MSPTWGSPQRATTRSPLLYVGSIEWPETTMRDVQPPRFVGHRSTAAVTAKDQNRTATTARRTRRPVRASGAACSAVSVTTSGPSADRSVVDRDGDARDGVRGLARAEGDRQGAGG